MDENNQPKKYSEMTFEEFLKDILDIKLNEQQLYMVEMFEEIKTFKTQCMNYNSCKCDDSSYTTSSKTTNRPF